VSVVAKVDRGQRRFPAIGFPLAVVYKFFDDQGNYLAAVLTYYAFIAIFPLLLLASSILGFILQGRPDLQDEVLNSALSNFPIIGDQLAAPEGLEGSTGAVIVGSLAAFYGCIGLGVAIQNVINAAWAVPRNSRPNPFLIRLNSLGLLFTAGVAVLLVSLFTAVVGNTEVFGSELNATFRWLIRIGNILIVGLVITALFRMAAASRHITLMRAAPGAFSLAVMWQFLQYLGTLYVSSVLTNASSVNATFALVLGLIGIIYIAAVMGVISVEINVVLARRLWPRALLTPFTDRVDLTEADRRAYAMYAQTQRHKGVETVAVRFDGRDGDTHEIVLDPKTGKTETIRNGTTGEIPLPESPSAERDESVPPVPGDLEIVPDPDDEQHGAVDGDDQPPPAAHLGH
jgi:membrane protein